MERKIQIGVILLVLLIIINAVLAGVFIFVLQEIQAPKIDVEFTLSEITTDEMRFTTTLSVQNNNQYDLSIKNLSITGKTAEGNTILDLHFTDSTITAKQHKIFTLNDTVSFDGEFSKIYSSVQGIFGINFAGIFEKTLPIQMNITASIQNILEKISAPTINVFTEVTNITEDGVIFHGILNIENPNNFEMSLENGTMNIETENETLVGEISQIQGRIIPNGTSQFQLNGTLLFEALNAKILTLRITGNASVHLIGIDKSVALAAVAQLSVPDLKQLLFGNESIGITLSLDAKIRMSGLLTTVGLKLYNPSVIPLQANDIILSIYGLTDGTKTMIAEKHMEVTTVDPKQQDYLETQILIPYLDFLTTGTNKIFPDLFVIEIHGDFSITGVNQFIPVTINATVNPQIL